MIEINLVPDVKQELIRAQRARAVVVTFSIFTGIIALGIVALLLLYVFGVQTVRGAFADNAIKEGSEKLASVEDLPKVLTIQNQLAKIDEQTETRQMNARIFDTLSAIIPPAPNQVQISNLSLDATNKTLLMEGQTPSYDSLEVFKKTIDGAVVTYTQDGQEMSDKLAEGISISEITFGDDMAGAKVVRFTIQFTYPESLFKASIPSVVIKLTNAGNVTDSYLGVPKSIFVTEGGTQ